MPARKKPVLDTTTARGKHVQRRLRSEVIIWLATVGADGRPHVVPVWYWWDGDTFLIYSVPGQKVRDIEANPDVAMHLNATDGGDDVVRIDGLAKRLPRQPLAYRVPSYMRKYSKLVRGYGWTNEWFSKTYHVAFRVRPTRFRIA